MSWYDLEVVEPTDDPKLERFCKAYRVWEKAIRTEHGDDPKWKEQIEAIALARLLITKSSLLARLVYGGERLRTKKCPVHKGKWSGINECVHGCDFTGWTPDARS